MAGRRVVLAAVLASVLAACSGAAPASPPVASPASPPVAPPTGSLAPAAGDAASPPSVSPPASSPSSTPPSVPTATPKPTPVPVPPKLTGVKFRERSRELDKRGERVRITQTVTWRAPREAGVQVRVYGVTECIGRPAHPKPDTHGPCLVEHTRLPASVLHLLAKAPASARKASWSWTTWSGCGFGSVSSDPRGPRYSAIVVAAYTTSGQSIFAIAEPGQWWEYGPGVLVC